MGRLVSIDGKGGRNARLAEAIRVFADAIQKDILDCGNGVSIVKAVSLAKHEVNTPDERLIIEALADFAEAILQAVEARYVNKLENNIEKLLEDVYDVSDDLRHLEMEVMRLQDNRWGNRW